MARKKVSAMNTLTELAVTKATLPLCPHPSSCSGVAPAFPRSHSTTQQKHAANTLKHAKTQCRHNKNTIILQPRNLSKSLITNGLTPHFLALTPQKNTIGTLSFARPAFRRSGWKNSADQPRGSGHATSTMELSAGSADGGDLTVGMPSIPHLRQQQSKPSALTGTGSGDG